MDYPGYVQTQRRHDPIESRASQLPLLSSWVLTLSAIDPTDHRPDYKRVSGYDYDPSSPKKTPEVIVSYVMRIFDRAAALHVLPEPKSDELIMLAHKL